MVDGGLVTRRGDKEIMIRKSILAIALVMIPVVAACSGGDGEPVAPKQATSTPAPAVLNLYQKVPNTGEVDTVCPISAKVVTSHRVV